MREKNKNLKNVANFLFEVGILSKTPRSGFYFLGSGEQSVAEHINRVVYIGYVLAMMEKNIDTLKVLKMCILHDVGEGRVSDLNYVHQKYNKADEYRAIKDIAQTLSFGDDVLEIIKEYKDRKTKEAILARDADQLEMILSLKEQLDIGNKRAKTWLSPALKRLKTKTAKEIAEAITKTQSDNWWFADKKDEWWTVSRNKEI